MLYEILIFDLSILQMEFLPDLIERENKLSTPLSHKFDNVNKAARQFRLRNVERYVGHQVNAYDYIIKALLRLSPFFQQFRKSFREIFLQSRKIFED